VEQQISHHQQSFGRRLGRQFFTPRQIICWFGIALFFFSQAALPLAAQAGAVPVKDRIVILISLDGFPAYALHDPKIPLPTLRKLMREGASAKAMMPVNPTVTWPNHTSMVTGVTASKHSVLFNGHAVLTENAPVRTEPWVDKEVMVRVPTIYDLASQAGLTTAQVDWVAIHNAKTINWAFAERPQADGKVEQELVGEGLISKAELAAFAGAPITWRDDLWLKAATYILRKHRPNLMLFHLLNTDSVQHRYGAGSLAANTALAYADSRVQMILDSLKENNLLQRSTIIVVSDHGFKTYKRTIRANALLHQEGLLKQQPDGKMSCDAYVVPEGGTAMVYITNPSRKAELTKRLAEMFAKLEGIEKVIAPAEYAALGYPDPKENPRMADFVLAAKTGYGFAGDAQGEVVIDVPAGQVSGTHGYLNTDPEMNAIFVAWGRGIRQGIQLEAMRNIDIAPTLGALLGLTMQGIEGKPLSEILMP
jgi:predicted AlkP superfamily pyrophosphatase or phosphodiesterase